MKYKITLLLTLILSLVIVSCGDSTPKHEHSACLECGLCIADDCDGTVDDRCWGHNEEPLIMPELSIDEDVVVNSIANLKITNLNLLEDKNFNNYVIETNDEYITYISNGYLVAHKTGNTTIKVTSKNNSKITNTINVTISDNESTNAVPEFKMTAEYITIDASLAIKLTNYSDLSKFDIIFSNPDKVEIDNRYRVYPKETGMIDIYVRMKNDHACINKYSFEVISLLPNIYVTKDTLLINEKSYINVSNIDETFEKSFDEYIWTCDNPNGIIENNVFYASAVGTYIITATSIYDERVTSSHQLTVVESIDTLNITLQEEFDGIAKKGDQFHIVLNNNYKAEDVTFTSTNNEVVRVYEDGKIDVINEGYAIITAYQNGNPSNKTLYRFYVKGIQNVDYIARLLNLALGEVGIVENRNEQGEYINDTKYNHWYNYDGPWCAMFVSWNWYHAGLSNDLLLKYMGCYTGMEWCVEKGIFHYKEEYTPKSGDIVFFLSDGAGHTGIVVYCDGDYIYTVEGNRSNRVDIWRISCINSTITGYASPHYPEYVGTPEDFSWIAGKDENGDYYWTPAGNQSTQ